MEGLGFRMWGVGLGFGVQGAGFRCGVYRVWVSGLGFLQDSMKAGSLNQRVPERFL